VSPRSVALYYSRPDLCTGRSTDAEPLELWPRRAEDRRQQHLRDFLDIAAKAWADRPV